MGSLLGYCAKTCGYCGFEDYTFQNIYSNLPDPKLVSEPLLALTCIVLSRRQVNIDADDIVNKMSILVFCGTWQRIMISTI